MDWIKPSKPKWMSQEAYDALPETIKIREFKVNGKVYVTTILDHKQYHKKDLVNLYGMRWQVEMRRWQHMEPCLGESCWPRNKNRHGKVGVLCSFLLLTKIRGT